MKVAEARELESELQRMREENAELRKRLSETSSLETAKKKAEARAEQLEQKVRRLTMFHVSSSCRIDNLIRWTR